MGEVCQLNPRADNVSDDASVSFVGMADLDATAGLTLRCNMRRFGEVRRGYTTFRDGDILIAKITPCFENNKIGQARLQTPVGAGSTEFHVLRPQETLFDRYALHFLRQQRIRSQGELRMTGSAGQRRIPANYLSALTIPLPPLDEQRRIAAILDKADSLRMKYQQISTALAQVCSSIYIHMFGHPLHNPRGYLTVPLDQVGTLERGVSKHRPRNDPALLDGPYPLIQTGDVTRSGGYITKHCSTYSDLGLAQSKLWPAGTLCITIAANIAQTGILTFPACFPDSVVGFSADEATTLFVRTWFTFLQSTLEASAPQSAQRNINLEILRRLPVPLPSIHGRRGFADAQKSIQSQIEVVSRAAAFHDELFASLQSRAFQGEL